MKIQRPQRFYMPKRPNVTVVTVFFKTIYICRNRNVDYTTMYMILQNHVQYARKTCKIIYRFQIDTLLRNLLKSVTTVTKSIKPLGENGFRVTVLEFRQFQNCYICYKPHSPISRNPLCTNDFRPFRRTFDPLKTVTRG